ncbi:hypothetical protein H4S07_001524 [Coemansia furcata]|uniref:Uncharacterized protein n=1 Tax=Coemansia furcata TaxID=417177 RepID=A0ACC1LNF1_9FUNG|nr:hypothetical protein H4S07_001524 [Coemansia furcata]
MDITNAAGRWAFILLLVGWSLGSVDSLGLDPTIMYEIDQTSGDPYLEIDVQEKDDSTGQVKRCTYYSQRCVGAADCPTGRHARYFTASTTHEAMDKPAFLIKDVWTASDDDSASDAQESSFLKVLHAKFGKSSELGGIFSQLVGTGPVCIKRDDTSIDDSTVTAFAGLPDISQDRQHRRTVTTWAGNMIYLAENFTQVISAISRALTALTVAHDK